MDFYKVFYSLVPQYCYRKKALPKLSCDTWPLQDWTHLTCDHKTASLLFQGSNIAEYQLILTSNIVLYLPLCSHSNRLALSIYLWWWVRSWAWRLCGWCRASDSATKPDKVARPPAKFPFQRNTFSFPFTHRLVSACRPLQPFPLQWTSFCGHLRLLMRF